MIVLFSTLRKVFFPIFNAIQANSRFLVRRQITNWVKKKAQWFSNILIVEIRNSEEDFLPVGFRVWVRVRVSFRVGGGQFSSAAIVLEPQNSLINIGENGLKIIIV